jgi:hypothetical protein
MTNGYDAHSLKTGIVRESRPSASGADRRPGKLFEIASPGGEATGHRVDGEDREAAWRYVESPMDPAIRPRQAVPSSLREAASSSDGGSWQPPWKKKSDEEDEAEKGKASS